MAKVKQHIGQGRDPAPDEPVRGTPQVRRITANNPSAFTFRGTNTYIVGTDSLAVIDPGPDDEAHLQHLLSIIGDRPVSHIFVTHTHRDHSTLAARLKEATGALTVGEGPHRSPRETGQAADTLIGSTRDMAFRPNLVLPHGGIVMGDGWALEAVHVPGHAANHLAFALLGEDILFSGDHVMGWSTTIVAPPDGSMADYIESLDKLLDRDDRLYLPGHGDAVLQPHGYVRRLRDHRRMREMAILSRIRAGDRTIAEVVQVLYSEIDPALRIAASLTVLAHLESLIERGYVGTDGSAALDGIYEPA